MQGDEAGAPSPDRCSEFEVIKDLPRINDPAPLGR
jgi:hypothetical protein